MSQLYQSGKLGCSWQEGRQEQQGWEEAQSRTLMDALRRNDFKGGRFHELQTRSRILRGKKPTDERITSVFRSIRAAATVEYSQVPACQVLQWNLESHFISHLWSGFNYWLIALTINKQLNWVWYVALSLPLYVSLCCLETWASSAFQITFPIIPKP